MQCPKCNATPHDGTKFCAQCGTALPRSCPACGKVVGAQARFCSECGSVLQGEPPAKTAAPKVDAKPTPPGPQSTPERRQLTIMFCDMVGSSALSTRLDPEEQREIVSAFQACCSNEIKRLGGMVAQYLGDGVLAYFGYPAAHEDDAERAVRTGLAILDVVGTLRPAPGVALQARIGIASGVVVVGDLVREGVTQENAAIGETTNLAARLQSLAEPDTVIIGPETHRLVGPLFEYRDLGARRLKGFSQPVQVRQVLGVGNVESRFEARHPAGASLLLGREDEFDLLLHRWEQAERGEGRVVLVTGEAGIGKSRLTRALQEHVRTKVHTPLIYHCSPYHRDSALSPVINQLTRAAGIVRNDSPEAKLAKLEAILVPSSANLSDDVPLLAALLSIPGGARYPLPSLTPRELRSRTLAVLVSHLKQLAARQPVLMIYEDLHWIDPTALELFTRVVELVPEFRLLLLATARSEFKPPWPSHRHVSTIALGRLDRREGVALVAGVTGGKTLPAEVLDQIVSRADGIPLFIEELTKTVLESGLLRQAGDTFLLTGPLPAMAIPSTLHASLLARLDRMATVKDVAQIGAVIGRQFSHDLIADVAALPETELRDALTRLVHAELIFQRGAPPDALYQFKHVLVQDAAYASLVRSRRQQLHARIASALEARFPELPASEPETLARHFTEAGNTERGIELWQRAGEQALNRCDNEEALSHLQRALALLADTPDSAQRAHRELQLQSMLGSAWMATRGFAVPEVSQAYGRARDLCRDTTESADLIRVLAGSGLLYVNRGELKLACDIGQQLLRLAERRQEPELFVSGHELLGLALLRAGDLVDCRAHMERAIHHYEDVRDSALRDSLGRDPPVSAQGFGALGLWLLGYPDQAVAGAAQARRRAHAIMPPHPFSLAYAMLSLAWVHQFRGEAAFALQEAEASIELATERGFPAWLPHGLIIKGWAEAELGKVEDGLAHIDQALQAYKMTGATVWQPLFLLVKTRSLARGGKTAEALETITTALRLASDMGSYWWEAELFRFKGEMLLAVAGTNAPEAQACFERALVIARQQSARSLELRTCMSRARLARSQGQEGPIADLAAVCDWFTEGLNAPELIEAREWIRQVR